MRRIVLTFTLITCTAVAAAAQTEGRIGVGGSVSFVRPVTVAPRVAIIGFGGFLFNRPDVVYRDRFGSEFRDRWKADAFVVSAGMVYSIF